MPLRHAADQPLAAPASAAKATRCRTIESLVEPVNNVLEYNYEKN
jgi:hypothetical protein